MNREESLRQTQINQTVLVYQVPRDLAAIMSDEVPPWPQFRRPSRPGGCRSPSRKHVKP
jgi:hypothetical protein